jgi:hypothetical protein
MEWVIYDQRNKKLFIVTHENLFCFISYGGDPCCLYVNYVLNLILIGDWVSLGEL